MTLTSLGLSSRMMGEVVDKWEVDKEMVDKEIAGKEIAGKEVVDMGPSKEEQQEKLGPR